MKKIVKVKDKNVIPAEYPSKTTVGYSGQVTVKTKIGDKVLQVRTYKNAGTSLLFQFLCLCTAGDFKQAELYRPIRLKLASNDNDDVSDAKSDLDSGSFDNVVGLSTDVYLESQPDIFVENTNKYKTILHFTVPYVYLTDAIAEKPLRQLLLYCSEAGAALDNSVISDIGKGVLAYFLFTNETGDAWQSPVTAEQLKGGNVTLTVDWQLSFDNQNN